VPIWTKRLGGVETDVARALAVSEAGDVYLAGFFGGVVDFGGGALISAGGADVFVAKFSGVDSAHLWSARFGAAGLDTGHGLAVDPTGDVVVAGGFAGTIDFGGDVLASAGELDIFVAKLSGTNGGHLWSRRSGGTGTDSAHSVVCDEGGDVFVTGKFVGTADFGGGAEMSAGLGDIFVARYASPSGAFVWANRYGGAGDDQALDVAVTAGRVAIVGGFNATVDFGGGSLTSTGMFDVFVAEYAAGSGSYIDARRFGGSGYDLAWGVALSGGNVLVAGTFDGVVDFGVTTLASAGLSDIFLLRLIP
jgi:hypothetical protein